MRPLTRICILTAIMLLINSMSIVFISDTTVSATPSGITRFYFTDFLDMDNALSSDFYGIFPPVSEEPSSKSNNSYYPPFNLDLISDFSEKQDEYVLWLSYWVISLFDDLYGMEGLEGVEILLPHPLRIVESYDNLENDSLVIDGDVEFNFEIISNIESRLQSNDEVKVSIYKMSMLPTLIKQKKVTLTQSTTSLMSQQKIILEDISAEIDPGSSLLFAIEMIPSNKTMSSLILREYPVLDSFVNGQLETIIDKISENQDSPLNNIAQIVQEVQYFISESNFTKEDLALMYNGIFGPSIVYDSYDHNAWVSVPFSDASNDENQQTYYLTNSNMLSTEAPSGEYDTVSLFEGKQSFSAPSLSRSKFLTSAKADLYLSHKDPIFFGSSLEVNVALKLDSSEIAHEKVTLDKTFLSTNQQSYYIVFRGLDEVQEIGYDSVLSLDIEVANGSNTDRFKAVDLLYGGSEYASSLSLSFTETDYISASKRVTPGNAKIIPGDSVLYSVDITSEKQDSISIQEKTSENKEGFWDITIVPTSNSFSPNEQKTVKVFLNSTKYSLEAYDQEPVKTTIEIFGNTGYTTIDLVAEVSEDAVTYSTLIDIPKSHEIKKGTNYTYQFMVTNNNTGLWNDSYIFTATSEQGFDVIVSPLFIDDVPYLDVATVNVTVFVSEKTEVTSDRLIFKVVSKNENGLELTETINYSVISPGFIADFYSFFESLSEDLGLDDSFGEFAPFILPILIILIVFIIIILLVFLLTNKKIKVTCSNKRKEIYPDESALFHLLIENKSAQKQEVYVEASHGEDQEKWIIDSSKSNVSLSPNESKTIDIQVTPSDLINSDDTVQLEVIIRRHGAKEKPVSIILETSIKNGTSDLSIEEVSHWPRMMAPKEKVTTSFKLRNRGSIQTKHIKVKMFINGKEKNKVEDIIIPARGYAEIRIPWIAEKGKNHVSLVVS